MENDLDQAISSILSGSQNPTANPFCNKNVTDPATKNIANETPKAPIHGTWFNSGGFTHSPNPTHPSGHPAVDMRAPGGTPIYPLLGGTVEKIGSSGVGGNFAKIKHSDKLSSYYAHMSTVNIHEGQKIDQNTQIGTIGNTGSAVNTFPHLHLEIYENNTSVDPAKYFSIPKYTDPKNNEEEKPYLKDYWLSPEHKAAGKKFNMAEHKAKKTDLTQIFSHKVDKLLKRAEAFYLLTRS